MGHFRSLLSGFCLRVGLVAALLAALAFPSSALADNVPSSVDVRLVQGSGSNEVLVQVKLHGAGTFGGILSAMTVTIRYDATSSGTLGGGTTFCSAWSSFPPSAVVVNGGVAYRTYNGFGLNRLEDSAFNGGCAMSLPVETWFTITTIPVGGTGCTAYTLGNDTYTGAENRDFYISMNGQDVTGQVVGGPVSAGNCAADCLGVIGGAALPGTACNDGNANTTNDTWNASCVCIGTVACTAPVANASTSNSPICSSSTLNLGVTATGTGPFSYSWTGTGSFSPNASSQNVTVSGAATGNYQVVVSNACGTSSASVPVVVNAAPSATINYTGSPFCTSGTTTNVTRTGSTGGTYTATPSGLSLNASTGAITLGSSNAGNYTVTYSIAASGGCSAFSTTASVVITAAPAATISYAGTPFCTSGSTANVTRTGSTGGTYSATPSGLSLNSSTGAITFGSSNAGTYTVTYSLGASGGCAAFSTTASVVITAAPSATVSYTGSPFCTSGTTANVTRSGSTGGTYSATPSGLSLNASTGAITLGSSSAGAYTVTYSIGANGGCAYFSTTTSVVITAAPSATISYAGTPFCTSGSTANVTRTGSTGGTYSATPSGLSLNSSTGAITLGTSSAGSYTVSYSIASSGGCSAFSTNASVVIGTSPSATISYAGTPYCTSGSTANVTQTGSTGGTYSASPAGLSINSTTGAITLGTSSTGSYTVTYSIAASGGCSAFSTTTSVVVTAAPSATISYSGSPFCTSGSTASVTRSGSTGGTYSASPSGLSLNSSTGAITLGSSSAGTYTVTYGIGANGGCSAFSTTASVVITAAPSATISYSGSPFCTSGSTANVTRSGSTGGTYSASPSGLSLNSSTGAITLGSSSAGTYTVTYGIGANGGCSAFSTTASVVITAAPSATISYSGSPFCTSGSTANVTRSGSTGGTYSASPTGLSLNSSTGAITLGSSSAGTYTVSYSIGANGGCAAFNATASVEVTSAPSATISYTGSTFCTSGSTANVLRSGSTGGTYSASPTGLSLNSSTGAITLGSSSAGTYTVSYSIGANGGCAAFSATASVEVTSAPSATISYTGSPFCTSGSTANVLRSGSTGGTYSASPTGLSIDPNTGAITLGTSSAGNYTVTYSLAAGGGCAAFSTTASVVLNASPAAAISYNGAPYCTSGGTANVSLSGNVGGTYGAAPAGLAINPNTGAINLGASTAGSYTVTYTIVASGGCSIFSTSANVQVGQAPTATIAYLGSPYCASAGQAVVNLSGTSGGSFTASPVGLIIDGGTGSVNLGTSAVGTYTVTYTLAASGGCATLSTTTAISVGAAPSATIAYLGSPFCASAGEGDVTRNGSSGGVYSATPAGLSIASATGHVDLTNSAAGSYTVTYAIAASGGCSAFSTTTGISIGAAPSATINYGGSPYCTSGGSVTVTRNGTPGGTFSSTPAGLSINAANGAIILGASSAGSYIVTYAIAAGGGCTAFSTTATVVVNAAPSATISYAGSPYCTDDGAVSVARTGTTGGTYSADPVGLSIDPASGLVTLGSSSAGTYTVTYTIAANGGCAVFNTTASVIVDTAPSASINYAGSPYCTGGGSASVTRTGTVGGTYSATPGGLSISATTGQVDLAASTAGSYSVTYRIAASGGCALFTTTATLLIGTAPSATITYSGSPYCTSDASVNITRIGSGGGSYTSTPAGLSLSASTGAINPGVSTPGNYTVTYSITTSGGCASFSTSTNVEIDAASTWYADADGDSAGDPAVSLQACEQPAGYVAVAGDLCPTDPNKLASGSCGCGVQDTDQDGDGIADCIDNCPTLAGQIGDSCDDGDTNTVNDRISANCECVGSTTYDCPVLQANIGDACDDGDANTVNDRITASCECVGTVVYDCPVLQANIGDACDDGDANTMSDELTANCECVGTVVYDCPVLQANIGDVCDDGNANTTNDRVTVECTCVGTMICVPPSITGTTSDAPICSGSLLNMGVSAGGTGPLSYAWTGTGSFSPGPLSQYVAVTGAATGNYEVTISNNCGSASATVSVVVNTAGSATIEYEGSPYCTSSAIAQVTRLGTPGGSFSATPVGLAIDPTTGMIDLNASTAGGYTVTYSIGASGACGPFSTTANISVEEPTVWYADVDGDGVGSDTDAILACEQPSGYVATSGDACPTDPNKLDPGACGCGIPDVDTDQDGVTDCIDGCPTDPNKIAPGACGCGVPDIDSDGDGVPDCIDNCPSLPGQIGDACDDNDPSTQNDVITANCVCVGTAIYDCPDLQSNVGDACDDGDVTTTDDRITADCSCIGTSIYDCPDLQANVGTACDDGDATTTNDVITADCACAGTSIYDCPDLQANIGDACDDGNVATIEDVITELCICEGHIIDGINGPAGSAGASISLFPNPNRTGLVTLHIEGLEMGQRAVLIKIQDASGRLVHQETAQAFGGVLHHGMAISKQVSQGFYMVEAIVGDRRYLGRLIVQ